MEYPFGNCNTVTTVTANGGTRTNSPPKLGGVRGGLNKGIFHIIEIFLA